MEIDVYSLQELYRKNLSFEERKRSMKNINQMMKILMEIQFFILLQNLLTVKFLNIFL